MKQLLNILVLLALSTSFAQEKVIETAKKDLFDNSYYVIDNTFTKKHTSKNIKTYTNLTLGNITSTDIINSFKIVLFYRDFNTVVLLDNQLNLIKKINFKKPFLLPTKVFQTYFGYTIQIFKKYNYMIHV